MQRRLCVSLCEETCNKIDSIKGDVARSRYIMRLIEREYESKRGKGKAEEKGGLEN